jgi:hypothetical protein
LFHQRYRVRMSTVDSTPSRSKHCRSRHLHIGGRCLKVFEEPPIGVELGESAMSAAALQSEIDRFCVDALITGSLIARHGIDLMVTSCAHSYAVNS